MPRSRLELVGTSPSPIEQLAAERVAATWLQVHHLDLFAASLPDSSTRQAKAVAKRQDQAHRRYMQALKSLGTLRRFLPSQPEVPAERVRRLAGVNRQGPPEAHGVEEVTEKALPFDQFTTSARKSSCKPMKRAFQQHSPLRPPRGVTIGSWTSPRGAATSSASRMTTIFAPA